MKVFISPLIPIVLAASLAIVSCDHKKEEFDGLKKEVEAMKDQLKASDLDMKTQINTLRFVLESYQDEVVPQLVALNEQMKADYDVLSAADILLGEQLEEAKKPLEEAIEQNSKDIAANAEAIQLAIADYKKLVAEAIKDYEAAIAKAQEDQASVDKAQDAAFLAQSAQIDTYKAAIDEAVETLTGAVEELAAMVENVEGSIEDLKVAIAELEEKVDANLAAAIAYTDALEATVKATTDALAERIEANEAAIKELNEETIPEIGEAIEALEASMVGLEGNLEALEEKKLDQDVFQAFLTTFGKWQDKVDTDIAGINGSLEQLQQFETVLDNEIKKISALVDVLNGDESVKGSVKQQIKALHEGIIEHLNELKGEIESEIQDLEDELAGIQEDLEAINADIVVIKGQIQDNATEIGKLDVRITNNEENIADLQKAKTELENKIAALNELLEQKEEEIKALLPAIEEKIALINGDKDTEGSIAYAVDQLDQAIQTQIGLISGRIDKTDAEIAELQKEIGKLQQYIQSLVFVPQYQDLKFGIPFTKIDDVYKAYNAGSGFAVVYKVAPAYLAQPLAKAVNDAIAAGLPLPFTFDIDSNLKTRAAENDPMLLIKDASGDDKTGKMTFFLSHKNFEPEGGNLDKYAISLRVDNADYNVHVASKYVQAAIHKIAEITVLTDYIYRPDPSTGMVDEDSKKAIGVEHNLNLQYTDGSNHTFVEGYELAAQDLNGVIRTFSQWEDLEVDMPEAKVTVTRTSDDADRYITANLKGTSSTFAMRMKAPDGSGRDWMKASKNHIGEKYNKYSFAFAYGDKKVDVKLKVGIAKHNGTFQIKFVHTMTWDYDQDAKVDHNNKGKSTSDWQSYTRVGDIDPGSSHLVVRPYITIGDRDYLIDESNKAYGLTALDVMRTFVPSSTLPTGCDFSVIGKDVANPVLSLVKFTVSHERLGETYEYTGTLPRGSKRDYSTGGMSAKVVIHTVDRKTEDIEITAPAKEVKLLDTGYSTSGDYYILYSEDLSNTLMEKLIQQGIYTDMSQKESALSSGELHNPTVHYMASGYDKCFAPDSPGTHEYFRLKSQSTLKSDILHKIATGSDCEGAQNPWALEIETYVGQKVKIHWPLSVVPKYNYRFVTNGINTVDNSFQVPIEWVGGTSAITKAKTELELIRKDDASIKVMYKDGTVEKEVAYGDYGDSDIKLIPRFKLVNATPGVDVDSTIVSGLPCASNVTYYSQTPSVGIKSALYVKSGNTEFYVPGSDKMYVGETPVTSVNVKPSNPIAATQASPVNPTIIDGSGEGQVELMMQDVLGHYIYFNGQARNNTAPYSGTIASIFNAIQFSVYSVNGSTSFSGWALKETDTPDTVTLKTTGVAAGSYTIVLKASTSWKDYYYTVKVNVQ